MLEFPSAEWIEEFHKILNENKAYQEAAKNWEGDFLFIITPDEGLDREYVYYMDLWHGKCREARLLKSRDEKKAAFVYEGPYSNWKKLLQGKIDPIKGLLTNKFRLKGDMAKVMRATKAAKELVSTTMKVKTQFK